MYFFRPAGPGNAKQGAAERANRAACPTPRHKGSTTTSLWLYFTYNSARISLIEATTRDVFIGENFANPASLRSVLLLPLMCDYY